MNRKDFKNKSEMQIFLSYFKPHRKLFFLDMACALGIAMIDLAFPFISRHRIYLTAKAKVENHTKNEVIEEILARVKVR